MLDLAKIIGFSTSLQVYFQGVYELACAYSAHSSAFTRSLNGIEFVSGNSRIAGERFFLGLSSARSSGS